MTDAVNGPSGAAGQSSYGILSGRGKPVLQKAIHVDDDIKMEFICEKPIGMFELCKNKSTNLLISEKWEVFTVHHKSGTFISV